MSHGRAPAIAIGAAAVALVISLIGVIVVVTRSDEEPGPQQLEIRVPAKELAKVRRESLRMTDDGAGCTVVDEALRQTLGLEPSDVITHLAGREIKMLPDIASALSAMNVLNMAIVYGEIRRDGVSILVRWKVDGDYRSARRDAVGLPDDPPKPSDPLLATIEKIDEHHYSVPRSTVDRVLANPMDYAKGARFVPSIGTDGVKLYAIRPSSLWASLGFKNGDMIRAINGHALSGVDGALEIYSKVRDARELAIDITRRGKYELITVTIR